MQEAVILDFDGLRGYGELVSEAFSNGSNLDRGWGLRAKRSCHRRWLGQLQHHGALDRRPLRDVDGVLDLEERDKGRFARRLGVSIGHARRKTSCKPRK